MKKFQTVPAAAIPSLLEADGALLLDCRMLTDYREGHVDNALHVHDGLVESLIKKADKQTQLVIYCYHGHNSEHLAELFGSFGFSNVYSIEGGYASWQQVTAS